MRESVVDQSVWFFDLLSGLLVWSVYLYAFVISALDLSVSGELLRFSKVNSMQIPSTSSILDYDGKLFASMELTLFDRVIVPSE